MAKLIEPHGGKLCNLIVDKKRKIEIFKEFSVYESYTLNDRQLCDLEMLLNGGFSPLEGFIDRLEYESVLQDKRLTSGIAWPLPITLDVPHKLYKNIEVNSKIVLKDNEGKPLALLTVTDIWEPDLENEANIIFGTNDITHPGVQYLLEKSNPYYISGKLEGIELPRHYDYNILRHTPLDMRRIFKEKGWSKIVAFQTRNPMHRAHKELVERASEEIGGNLLIHPAVGMTKPGDVDHYTRVRCYEKIMDRFDGNNAMLSLLPIAMRMGGPREALWHAIIRKNYGCTHFIVGRDHAGPGLDSDGSPFYGPYEAQDLVDEFSDEIGISMVPFKLMVYVKERAEYMPVDKVPSNLTKLNISGTELRNLLDKGKKIPDWFTYSDISEELRHSSPPRDKRGFTVFFTGLSGSGKSTIANALLIKLLEQGRRRVTLLDGDIVRINLSSELGFSKEHRDLNIQRIGFVASEITKNGGIAICAPIAPYENIRMYNRELISRFGGYIEIYISTPLEICEKRDVKGLYAKARQGIIKGFTGIDDPYERPGLPEITIDTANISEEDAVNKVLRYLEEKGYLR